MGREEADTWNHIVMPSVTKGVIQVRHDLRIFPSDLTQEVQDVRNPIALLENDPLGRL